MKVTTMTHISRFVSLAIAFVEAPASISGTAPGMTHLAAMGMLIAQRGIGGDWRFSLRSHALAAGDGEDGLLLWASEAMPASGVVLGWQLADRIVPPLLSAGAGADPDTGRAFLDRLARLVTMPSVDLAVPHGGAGAPPLAEIAGAREIAVPTLTPLEIESAWAFGNRALLASHVEAQAVATWRLWLAEANGAGEAASTAFERWIAA